MDDLITISDEARGKTRRRILFGLLIIYFTALFIYSINISQEKMPYFTRITGFDAYKKGGTVTMRLYVIGMKEMAPIPDFTAKLELTKPSSGRSWTIYEGAAGRSSFLEIMAPVPPVEVGSYTARLTINHPEYGQEVNEFLMEIVDDRPPRAVDIQQLDEKYTKSSDPIKANKLSPPAEIRFICNNKRFISSVNNRILVVAENPDSGLPVEGLKFEISALGKEVAEVTTDNMGMADFSYYPAGMGAEKIDFTVTDKRGNSSKHDTILAPVGSQVVLSPEQWLWPAGKPIKFKVETLRSGDWYIDLLQHGNWLATTEKNLAGAPTYIEMNVPDGITGPVYIQAAADFNDPGTSYDAFYAFIYGPKDAEIPEDDPRLKNIADPNDPKLEDIKLEKPLKLLWSYAGASPTFPNAIVERWQRKINALSVAKLPYSPRELARQILSEVPKDYLLMPELVDTREARLKSFTDTQKEKRDNVIILLGLSGIVVVFVLLMRIFKEVQSRTEDVELEMGGKNVTMLVVILGITVGAYAFILYFLSILDWHVGL